MSAQTSYAVNPAIGTVGTLLNNTNTEVTTRLMEGSDVSYGRGVYHGTATSQCKLGGSDKKLILGITLITASKPNTDGVDVKENTPVRVVRTGSVWVKTKSAVAVGDKVYVTPADGTLSDVATGNHEWASAKWDTPATAGSVALIRIQGV